MWEEPNSSKIKTATKTKNLKRKTITAKIKTTSDEFFTERWVSVLLSRHHCSWASYKCLAEGINR